LPRQYWDVPLLRKPYKDSELLDLVEKAFALSRRHWRKNRAATARV
jgi:FixJ family two-component response regulator